MRRRSGVIIVEGGRLALIRRELQGRVYFVIPGGGIEPGETAEVTARREAREELGVEVRLDQLAAIVDAPGHVTSEHHYFSATVVGGEFGSGDGPEFSDWLESEHGTYTAIWFPLSELVSCDVWPHDVALAVAAGRISAEAAPLRIVLA